MQALWTSGSDSGILSLRGVLPQYILTIRLCRLAAATAGSNMGGVLPRYILTIRLHRLAAATDSEV